MLRAVRAAVSRAEGAGGVLISQPQLIVTAPGPALSRIRELMDIMIAQITARQRQQKRKSFQGLRLKKCLTVRRETIAASAATTRAIKPMAA